MIFDINRQLNWYNHPFDICCHPLDMCKEGWCVGLGKEGVVWGWEELSKIPWEWDRKQWRRNRDFQKAGQAWSSIGCLKEGGLEPSQKLCYIWIDFISFTCFYTSLICFMLQQPLSGEICKVFRKVGEPLVLYEGTW